MTTATTLPAIYPTYSLTENKILPSLCSVNMGYHGAIAVEPTYTQAFPWSSVNARSDFQVQVPGTQPIKIIFTTK